MIEDRKKSRLEKDREQWSRRKKEDYVSLSEIKDSTFTLIIWHTTAKDVNNPSPDNGERLAAGTR